MRQSYVGKKKKNQKKTHDKLFEGSHVESRDHQYGRLQGAGRRRLRLQGRGWVAEAATRTALRAPRPRGP